MKDFNRQTSSECSSHILRKKFLWILYRNEYFTHWYCVCSIIYCNGLPQSEQKTTKVKFIDFKLCGKVLLFACDARIKCIVSRVGIWVLPGDSNDKDFQKLQNN